MSDKKDTALLLPSVDAMIQDALDTVQIEITRYKTKATRGQPLSPTETKILQGYIKALVDLSKEDRERAKEADLSDLSTEDLLKLLGGKAKQLPGKSE